MDHKKAVTSSDVAKRAGVSRSTVSRALNDLDCVNEETRKKILEAADELGYQINMLGRSLNQQKTNLIGVVVRNLSDPFHVLLLETLLKVIDENKFLAIVSEITSDDDIESTIKKFAQFRVSGVMITSGSPPIGISTECKKLNIPVILINRLVKDEKIDIVCSDNYKGTKLAIEHLLEAKCKTFHFLNIENSTYSGKTRGEAFHNILKEYQDKSDIKYDFLSTSSNTYKGGYACAKYVYENSIKIEGIFCANDALAIGFIDGLRKYKKFEPGIDYSIIGFDDIKEASWDSYKLTTIKQNVREISNSVIERLKLQIDEQKINNSFELIPVSLIKRESVKINK